MQEEHDATQRNLADQMQVNKQNQEQIQHLQKKIENFSNNQSEVSTFQFDHSFVFICSWSRKAALRQAAT